MGDRYTAVSGCAQFFVTDFRETAGLASMDHSKAGSTRRRRFIGRIEWRNERIAIGDKPTTEGRTAEREQPVG